ncbi:enoyl-CoA hydratase-related protein [Pseudoramibacter sp.]|jgi:enoyl-CoA hydratase|uniref:enoyl-CoA hydratase-related protein n=1 Tax=Pseudoramibacter sp. TaxID=2034862 RepID=UPI0025F40971|nr:enoyl-CoA hydratase-related protein [Pseudoramibacter sp.]MCH4072279.1 enoyl-CoA hydratase-related protein [Pseudoramibacter sp.]MCH4106050.1 enoyl-CoA hydratase-related protein [Pseudoramibacter sp.]
MSFVTYEAKGMIGIVTINREKALNALNTQVLNDLEAVIDGVDYDTIRCLIITGAGQKSFVAGADIGEMAEDTKAQGRAFCEHGNRVFRKIETLPIPVIAAVNGFALGGGCELSMACDIRIASDNAVFGQPEVGLGITPGFGGTQRLMRRIPVGKAKEMIYASINIKAEEALQWGLVNAVYPQADLMDEAEKLANRIAKQAPIAVRMAKAAMNEGIDMPMDSAIQVEVRHFSECFETADQKEGMKAFMEKRKHEPFQNK